MRRTLALVAVLTAAAVGGCGGEQAVHQTSTVVRTVTTSATPVTRTARAGAIALERYQAEAYAARIPADWTLEADETVHEGYAESKWRDPNDTNSSLTIDVSTGQAVSAASKAAEVRAAVQGEPSYSEQGFAPTTLGSYSDAFKWTFRLSGDQRIDYFMRECDTGIAVLGSTAPARFDGLRPIFARVARSIKVECGGGATPPPRPRAPPPAPPTSAPPETGPSEDTFCATHECIPNFHNGTGSIVQCVDGQWSHSGGRPGACSYHGGVAGGTNP